MGIGQVHANRERQFTFIGRETSALAANSVEYIPAFMDRVVVEFHFDFRDAVEDFLIDSADLGQPRLMPSKGCP
jgi:hypothetical protein